MKLPEHYFNFKEWVLIGPMGPTLPSLFATLPSLAVDGGALYCSKVDIWVGDFDSNSTFTNADITFSFPAQKAESDLALALKLLSQINPLTLHLWGFMGGRFDHALINIGETLNFFESQNRTQAIYYDELGRVGARLYSQGTSQFEYHGLFSLIVNKLASVKITGLCEYQLDTATEIKPFSSQGLSNRAFGKILIESSGPLAIIFPEPK